MLLHDRRGVEPVYQERLASRPSRVRDYVEELKSGRIGLEIRYII